MNLNQLKGVSSGLFTSHEMKSIIQVFQSNLEELFWIINNMKGNARKVKLIGLKYLYLNRFIQAEKNGLMDDHVFQKLMTFIEIAIYDPKRATSGKVFVSAPSIGFVDLFVSKEIGKRVVNGLLKENYLQKTESSLHWVSKGRNSGLELIGLFSYLNRKSVIKETFKSNFQLISEVVYAEFGIKKSPRTYFRMNDQEHKSRWKKFSFLGL